MESNTNGNLNRRLIQNFSWRLGVREERKFSTDLSGVFQIEIGVAPDDATQSESLASRTALSA